MSRLVFDIEANGLLRTVTKAHCIGIKDIDSGERWSTQDIPSILDNLYNADELIGHNIIGYDFPLLKKLYGWQTRPGQRKTDTLLIAQMLKPMIAEEDKRRKDFPSKLIGRHSLRAWGIRLGCLKGDFGSGDSWDEWSQDMQDYMMQDIEVTHRLLSYLKPWEYPQGPFDLENAIADICTWITYEGWPFDIKAAQDLHVELVTRRDPLELKLVDRFGSWTEVDKVFVPKRDNKTLGYTKGVKATKHKTVVFNPGSRVHIERKLREVGWQPEVFTESGRAKLDEDIISKIDIPEAKDIVEYLLVSKRLSQLADGDSAWLKRVERDPDGVDRIHGSYNTIGCITGRSSHYNPNIAQVPSNGSPYGHECRSLFTVPRGWSLVGADMSGLELRVFAHYLHSFDNGAYGELVVNGDIHTYNQEAAGLPTRDNAKTMIYGTLYGAGDKKIGKIVNGSTKDGAGIRKMFETNVPAYGKLVKVVKDACKKGWLKGLDGRRLIVRKEHAALNTLLQSAGAILCKQWLADFYEAACKRWTHGWSGDFVIIGWVHDELQVACRQGLEKDIGELLITCALHAGDPYDFKVPLDSKYVVGRNWSETH